MTDPTRDPLEEARRDAELVTLALVLISLALVFVPVIRAGT